MQSHLQFYWPHLFLNRIARRELVREQGELTCGGGRPNPFAGGGFPIHRGVAEQGVPKQNSTPQAPVGVGPQP